jgi:hypothetical protein
MQDQSYGYTRTAYLSLRTIVFWMVCCWELVLLPPLLLLLLLLPLLLLNGLLTPLVGLK